MIVSSSTIEIDVLRTLPFAIFTSLICGACASPRIDSSELTDRPGIQLLVFTKTTGFRHASIEAGIAMFHTLGNTHDFDIENTEDATALGGPELFGYDAVVFLSTTGDVLNAGQQNNFARYIQAGGGFVGIHAASDTEFEWPWYGRLVGGYFAGHPEVQPATLRTEPRAHPASDGLPDPWIRTDEWYEFRDFNDRVQVILRIDESSYKEPSENPTATPRPIAWFHEYDGGRAFYTALGHTLESYTDSSFVRHVWGGVRSVLPNR